MTSRPDGWRSIRVVVLDLDDTLYLERDYAVSGFHAVDRWLKERHGIAGFLVPAMEHFAAGRRGDIFDATLAQLGMAPTRDLIEQMIAVYRDHAPDIRLLPDAERFLRRILGRLPTALLTDGYLTAQRRKIAALGLGGRLDPIVCTDEWGRAFWKPHRHGFELIQRRFALPPEAFVYVADNPAKDFVAPRALGWRTVQIVRPEGVHIQVPAAGPQAEAEIRVANLDPLTEAFSGI